MLEFSKTGSCIGEDLPDTVSAIDMGYSPAINKKEIHAHAFPFLPPKTHDFFGLPLCFRWTLAAEKAPSASPGIITPKAAVFIRRLPHHFKPPASDKIRRKKTFKPSRGHGSPWGRRSGIRCGICGRRSSGTWCDQCRWSFSAWPSRPSCLYIQIHVSLACPFLKPPRYNLHVSAGKDDSGIRTLASLSSGVTAVSTGVLLDVQGAAT